MFTLKKLIEVALPLDVINRASAREKSIRHGHPSTLHLWWSRKPTATARAVLFASLIDDPSEHEEKFPTPEAQQAERERLFKLIGALVSWENSGDEKLFTRARDEIKKSIGKNLPAVFDPFAGGGTIPLEAQRLGLKALAADLNPVAVMINKAMIELPLRFKDKPPVNPAAKNFLEDKENWRGAHGLAADILYYGKLLKTLAFKKIGALYPKADGKTVIAWLWARTVTCSNPICRRRMPLIHSFKLSTRQKVFVQPIIDDDHVRFEVRQGDHAPEGTVSRNGARCLFCGSTVPLAHVRAEGKTGNLSAQLMAIVAEGQHGRVYLSPDEEHERLADVPAPDDFPDGELPDKALGFRVQEYGITEWHQLFTNRQLKALTTFSDLIDEVKQQVIEDGGDKIYSDTLAVYFAFIMNKSNQRYSMAKKLNEQLASLSNIYLTVYDLDLIEDTFKEIQSTRTIDGLFQKEDGGSARAMLESNLRQLVSEKFLDDVLRFVNLATLNDRLKDFDTVTIEYQNKDLKWRRCRFIASRRLKNGMVSNVLWLIEDIDKEKKERDELLNLSERAFAASEAKSSFLSNMSHEIRTPINAILGMNEIIIRECNDAAITSYAESIKTAGSTLLGLINDILDFSKIEAGKIEIIPADYCLSSLLNDLVNMIQIKAQSKGLALTLDFDKNLPKVLHGDEVRIKQVITNILTNAVKYTEKGIVTFSIGFKKIDGEPNNIILQVSVKDTGIGIKPEDLKKLFAVFERIEEKRNRNIEGTGLGMAITKNLLHLMKSKLQVESIYGLGTKCSFELKQKVIKWEPLGDYETAYKKSLNGHGKYREKFRAPTARVLVIDDNQMNLLVFQNLLKQTEIKIDTASGGNEGLLLTQENKYDVIFLDHMMPDKDGIETLKELKSQPSNPNFTTPTICLTANAISGAKEKYLAEGFDNYLTKPINPKKLEEMLLKYLPAEKVNATTDDVKPTIRNEHSNLNYKHMNIATGLEYSNGSEKMFRVVLEMFCNLRDEKKKKLQAAFDSENWKNYTVFVHGLKSTALSIGGEKLSDLAKNLETAGNVLRNEKSSDSDKHEAHEFIKSHHVEAMKLYDELVEEGERYLK